MNTIRYGKIARLPAEIREQLNQRLANHESSTTLLAWLNALPEVQTVLTREFGGKGVNKVNILNWRHGGHAEWRQRQEAQAIMKDLQRDGHQFSEAAGGSVVDTMAEWLAARYVVGMKKQMDRDGNPAAGWERMREFCQDVVALRRGEYRAQRLELVRAGLALRGKKMGYEPPGPPNDERRESSKGGIPQWRDRPFNAQHLTGSATGHL